MRVPAVLYGPSSAVKARARRWTARCLRTGDWPGEDGGEDAVDTADEPGLLLLSPPTAILAGEPAFHCYLPGSEALVAVANQKATAEQAGAAFERWLGSAWGLLGLLAHVNAAWFRDPARYRPFLGAVLPRWDELYGAGQRYSVGSTHGQDLWTVSNSLKYVLANMGVSADELRAPLPPGGLAEVVRRTDGWDGVPVVERWD